MLLLFAISASAFLLFQEGAITGSDGASMFEVTRSIVTDGDVTVDAPGLGVPGEGGPVSKYGIGQPLVSLVPYLAVWPVARALGDRGDALERFAVSCTIPILGALLVVAIFALGRRLGAGRRAAALVGIGSVAGTFVLPYTKEFFSEPLATLGITIAIERALARRPGWSAAALGLAILTRPQTVVVLPFVACVWWRSGGPAARWRTAIPLVLTGGGVVAYNIARFGEATEFGYAAEPGFSTPLLTGARGLLLDPSASLLLFAPVVVLLPAALTKLWRSDADAVVMLGGNLLATFVLTALWWSWAGGWSWGPRLLIPGVVPALAALAPWIEQRRVRLHAASALLALGLLVSLPAMLVSTRAQQLDVPPPENGPRVLRQYELLGTTARFTASNLSARPEGDHRRYLSLWQVNVIGELGKAGSVIAIPGSLVLIGGAIVAGRKLREQLADQNGIQYTDVSE